VVIIFAPAARRYHPTAMNETEIEIWNLAADHGADGESPEGTPPGLVRLAWLLRVYNSAMGGGLYFAFEVNEPFRIRNAIEAMRYFGLTELAALMAGILEHGIDNDYLTSREDEFYHLLGRDLEENLHRAYRDRLAAAPADFDAHVR
jgi:hypothetical protein